MSSVSSKIKVQDSDNLTIDTYARHLDKYEAANTEDSETTSYYGFVDKTGNWYIMRRTVTDIDYCKGITGYAAAWVLRADSGTTYAKFDVVF